LTSQATSSFLTLFAIPKRFEGHFGLIQRNAIRSWARLVPAPDIILLGSDEGTAEMAAEIGARHIGHVAASPSGAPMLDDVFRRGQEQARTPLVCFINADIVLTPDWYAAVRVVEAWRREFLMVGRRWDLELTDPIDFGEAGWSSRLVEAASTQGRLATNMFIDYFVFPRGMLAAVPPFVIGRPGYDNWLLWSVRRRGIPLVDATGAAPVIHQNHDYSHIKGAGGEPSGRQAYLKGEDTRHNAELTGGWTRYFTTDHATHTVGAGRVHLALATPYLRARIETVRRHLVDVTRPLRRRLGIDMRLVERLRGRPTPPES